MRKQRQINLRLEEELYQLVKYKCKQHFGIGITPLIKIFLKSFVTQKGVGFYVGDDDFCLLLNKWLSKKSLEKERPGCAPLSGPKLRDLYMLNGKSRQGW